MKITPALSTFLFIFSSLNYQAHAQTYTQKLEAVSNKVHLKVGPYISHIEKAEAISQIYEMIIESSSSHYFSKNNGLVQTIVLDRLGNPSDMSEESLSGHTRLRGNTLIYPTRHNLVEVIIQRLPEEQNILQQIPLALQEIKKLIPKIMVTFESEDVLYYSVNSNITRLQLLNHLIDIAEASPQLLSSLRSLDSFQVVDSVRDNKRAEIYFHKKNVALLRMGRDSSFSKNLYANELTLQTMLNVFFESGLGIRSGYLMSTNHFASALAQLDNYLEISQSTSKLKANGVQSFEFDSYYEHRNELFKDGILYVGYKYEDMERVVNLLFP